jgi:hypothetical protein
LTIGQACAQHVIRVKGYFVHVWKQNALSERTREKKEEDEEEMTITVSHVSAYRFSFFFLVFNSSSECEPSQKRKEKKTLKKKKKDGKRILCNIINLCLHQPTIHKMYDSHLDSSRCIINILNEFL